MATPNERSIPESRAKMSFSLRDSSVLRRSRLNASNRLKRLAIEAITPSSTSTVTITSWSGESVRSI